MKEVEKELSREASEVELPQPIKQKITDEILQTLKSLDHNSNVSVQRGRCTLISLQFYQFCVNYPLFVHVIEEFLI